MKKRLKKLFVLPPIPTLLISIPSYVLVIYALSNGGKYPIISHTAYILSSYAFIITVTGVFRIIKRLRKKIAQHSLTKKLLGIPFISRWTKEASFRMEASLYQGLLMNILYVGVKFFSGIYYHSVWFIAISVYYILLALTRASLLQYVRTMRGRKRDEASQWRRYRLCGIILLFMNQALTGIIILVITRNNSFKYPGLLIYAIALYTFYATIMAVMNVIKFRKNNSPIISSVVVINLTASLVSMLSLETAMIAQFGSKEDAFFRQMMTACTGAVVSVIVLGMAVYMIIHATKKLKGGIL